MDARREAMPAVAFRYRATDSKPVSLVLTQWYYARPSSIYRRLSRQSKLGKTWSRHVSPSSSPHRAQINKRHLPPYLDFKMHRFPLPESPFGRSQRFDLCAGATVHRDGRGRLVLRCTGYNLSDQSELRRKHAYWYHTM